MHLAVGLGDKTDEGCSVLHIDPDNNTGREGEHGESLHCGFYKMSLMWVKEREIEKDSYSEGGTFRIRARSKMSGDFSRDKV